MQKITTFLTFKDQAEEAVALYTSAFRNARVVTTTRYPEGAPRPAGSVMTIAFELEGQTFIALNGGPEFQFTEGISLMVGCETQAEIDALWEKLTAGGGKPVACGWLRDRFGVAWQIVPRKIWDMISDPDPARAHRALQAVWKMVKLDLAEIERAYAGG